MQEYGRELRVADFVRDELAQIIQRQMRDPRVGMVSVNDVRVSKDLSYADVYVSSLDTPGASEKEDLVLVLNKAAGFFRSELAKRHSMRTTPKPRFHYDEVVDRGPRLEKLIDAALRSDRKEDNDGSA
ncbi:MAG: 30S ribosome-binding factor RbfA [Gammaproteobacteria bacterium]|nr:30S ribosome-binding factor RbfA [Gammaproteobacteria bacterium]